jgi:site-specific DNA-methyltransferase (adenine-specific)
MRTPPQRTSKQVEPSSHSLSPGERTARQTLETRIERGLRLHLEAAKALREIRDRRLYRDEFPSFEDYCAARWQIKRSQAHRLCDWAKTAETLSPFGERVPLRESHARPLTRLSPELQLEVWDRHMKRRGDHRDSVPQIEQVVAETLRARAGDHYTASLASCQSPVDDGNVICGDVLSVLPNLPDASINLVVTSPPYAEQRDGHYPGIPEAEYPAWLTKVTATLRPKLAADASVLIVIRPHVRDGVMSDYVLRTRLALREDGWSEVDEYVWHKGDGGPNGSNIRLRRVWESVLHFAPSRRPFIDLRACGNDSKRIGFKGRDRFGLKGRRQLIHGCSKDYSPGRSRAAEEFCVPVGGNARGINHPAQFPPKLAEQLVATFSRPNDLVADIFAGSGTTLLAAQSLGRRCLGIVPEYAQLCRQRLRGQRSDAA